MMSHSYTHIGLISGLCLASLLFSGCGGGTAPALSTFTTPIYTPQYATGFDIKGAEGTESVIITTRNPWQGADSVTTRLFVARDGDQAPADFSGQVLEGEARRIVAMSSTHIALLDAIGEVSRVVGVSGISYITNESVQARRDSIGDVSFEGNTDYELLLSLEPDIVLLYGVNGASVMEKKLVELGIPFMYVGDYLEQSPLGKAEWIVALAEITGKRGSGIDTFAKIPAEYLRLKDLVADACEEAPKVMINAPYGDSWFMPSTDSYMVELIRDAGGHYLYPDNNGNAAVAIDMEKAYLLTLEADVWLNPGTTQSLGELRALCPRMADVPAMATGRVYNNNARTTTAGGNDFFESAIVHPDIALRDLIKIFHPSLISEDLHYYRQLK